MMADNEHLVVALTASSKDDFYAALARVPTDYHGPHGADFAIAFAKKICSHATLHELAQANRLRAVLGKLALDASGLAQLAKLSRALPAHLKNAVDVHLPATHRRRTGNAAEDRVESPNATANPGLSHQTAITSTSSDIADADGCSTVLLLGTSDIHAGNKQLLINSSFGPVVLDTLDKLHNDLSTSTDTCACVVDGSFLADLDAAGQATLFKTLARYSTFVWIRVDESHLKLTHDDVRTVLREGRRQSTHVAAHELSIQPNGILRQAELPNIARASTQLRARQQTQFIPGELSGEEIRLLVAALHEHWGEAAYDGIVEVRTIETRVLQGGFSSARLLLVKGHSHAAHTVAKIAPKEHIINEIDRFHNFVQPWDNTLRPRVCFHGDAALILFQLVPHIAYSGKPAPMLAERLCDLWNAEVFANGSPGNDTVNMAQNLGSGLEAVAQALHSLNAQPVRISGFECLANPDVAMPCIKSLEARGITWALDQQARDARELAVRKFAELAQVAIVHGDMHLRNILVRGDHDMHVIDYAGSGPGHPAVDLVRLELALYLGVFRQLDNEALCLEFQKAMSLGVETLATLQTCFPSLNRSLLNQVCVRGCVAARDHAIAVAKAHGGTLQDYLAAKYLIAWQSLVMENRQVGLIRSIIGALSPAIASW